MKYYARMSIFSVLFSLNSFAQTDCSLVGYWEILTFKDTAFSNLSPWTGGHSHISFTKKMSLELNPRCIAPAKYQVTGANKIKISKAYKKTKNPECGPNDFSGFDKKLMLFLPTVHSYLVNRDTLILESNSGKLMLKKEIVEDNSSAGRAESPCIADISVLNKWSILKYKDSADTNFKTRHYQQLFTFKKQASSKSKPTKRRHILWTLLYMALINYL